MVLDYLYDLAGTLWLPFLMSWLSAYVLALSSCPGSDRAPWDMALLGFELNFGSAAIAKAMVRIFSLDSRYPP